MAQGISAKIKVRFGMVSLEEIEGKYGGGECCYGVQSVKRFVYPAGNKRAAAICNLQKSQRFCRSEAGKWPRESENVGQTSASDGCSISRFDRTLSQENADLPVGPRVNTPLFPLCRHHGFLSDFIASNELTGQARTPRQKLVSKSTAK